MIFLPKISALAVFALAIFLSFTTQAQKPDSTVLVLPDSAASARPDSSQPAVIQRRGPFRVVGKYATAPVRFLKKDYPNPRKAVLLAAVLPGAGQLYNKKWWKVPIVYGALGGMAWWAYDNGSTFSEYSINYKALVDDDPNTKVTDPKYEAVDVETLRAYRDRFRKYTEQTYLGLGLMYLLSVTDAYVDAQLYNFDVSDDLSLQLKPAIISSPGWGATWGLGVQLKF